VPRLYNGVAKKASAHTRSRAHAAKAERDFRDGFQGGGVARCTQRARMHNGARIPRICVALDAARALLASGTMRAHVRAVIYARRSVSRAPPAALISTLRRTWPARCVI